MEKHLLYCPNFRKLVSEFPNGDQNPHESSETSDKLPETSDSCLPIVSEYLQTILLQELHTIFGPTTVFTARPLPCDTTFRG